MAFLWEFETEGRTEVPTFRRCHRGPMLPVEVALTKSFTRISALNTLRARVAGVIVDSTDIAVRSREILLRVLHSNLGGIFVDYRNIQPELEALICEKRNSLEVAGDLDFFHRDFIEALRQLRTAGVLTEQLDLIYQAIRSKNAILRVAGYCSIVLLGAILEIRS